MTSVEAFDAVDVIRIKRDKGEVPEEALRWMIEELRVTLFAQRLGTAHAVSLRRIQKAVDKLR